MDNAQTSSKRDLQRPRLTIDEYEHGVVDGDRTVLGRAITLIESSSEAHQQLAQELLKRLMPRTGGAARIGITGPPGVGKSTFIESLGMHLVSMDKRVAVLAVDPSSGVTGGSILGDKTRMMELSVHANAFVRPSPSAGTLGGVAQKTRETLMVCEAAGFDVVLVETVGVGQSETAVAEMTDFFLVLMQAGGGDELQGIKRGVLELADMIAVNKADGSNLPAAKRAAAELQSAVRLTRGSAEAAIADVVLCSALSGEGVGELWGEIEIRLDSLRGNGAFDRKRRGQMLRWMWQLVDERLREITRDHDGLGALRNEVESDVHGGRMHPQQGAQRIVGAIVQGLSKE